MQSGFVDIGVVLLAIGLFPVFVVGHILMFRRQGESVQGYVLLPLAFFLYGLLWFLGGLLLFGTHVLSPRHCITGLATVGFFCLGYMQVFSLTCRGFSLRILVDLDKHGALDLDGVMREYSDGRGMDWLFNKRITSMESLQLVRCEDKALVLLWPRGGLAAWLGLWTKRILKIGPGG